MSNLFDLNDRIFAAMDELDAADEDGKAIAIEKARAKVSLFNTAISNANLIARLAQQQEAAMDGLAVNVGTTRILLGQPQVVAEVERPALPEFDAIGWARANAHGHSASWVRDRLNKASGAEYSFEEVRAICDEARVDLVELGEKATIQQAESDSYGLRGPAKGYVR